MQQQYFMQWHGINIANNRGSAGMAASAQQLSSTLNSCVISVAAARRNHRK